MGIKLVAYDGSDASIKALKYAVGLVKPGDELLVVMVLPVAVMKEFAQMPPDVSAADAHDIVNLAVSELHGRGIPAMGFVCEGDIADELVKVGANLSVDLIIVGNMGVSKTGRFSVGNVSEKVSRNSKRPVMVVR